MRNLKAEMFNRKASDPANKPDQILDALNVQSGQTVADIGAGGGYFTLRLADIVGSNGHVFAVDTNPGFLEFIKATAQERGVDNVEVILVTEETPPLPRESLDLIFMRNLTHHLSNRVAYFAHLRRTLKPEGRIAVIEYTRSSGSRFHQMFGHFVPKEVIVAEMREAGYRLNQDFGFLPKQSFTIFSLH